MAWAHSLFPGKGLPRPTFQRALILFMALNPGLIGWIEMDY
ncbi:hypothetical protein Dbac_2587 [Desulfomicrobium baculatum DSM 4028]|uniref:Uncharacterized protein n=1 Tax=Desulfomicrobium baculatum (strain DSM 4028 / VKM B-1378 / X) TaxID=525897 RepID=C7LSB6_DESBD|nr:hypothetical protein Dbac_2587 [Desulfomicrobium baculatum DSM 4028]